jgi:HPt (histidine-containing phosphotransfer) domain-containing protein
MHAAFAALRQQFCAGLAARQQRIEHAPGEAERIQALHQLAGAAGSYGLPELSAAAKTAELLAHNGSAQALASALAALYAQIQQVQQA